MGLAVTTAATATPVSLAEAKAHLRVDTTDEDALVTALIQAATEYAQAYTSRRLMTTVFDYTLDSFPSTGVICLPEPPLQSVASVTYIDTNGDSQTWSSSLYTVKTDELLGTIRPAYNEDFPSTRDEVDAVTVAFTAGYVSAADVPSTIKSAMLLLIGHLYENRESFIVGQAINPNPSADMLLDLNRIMKNA